MKRRWCPRRPDGDGPSRRATYTPPGAEPNSPGAGGAWEPRTTSARAKAAISDGRWRGQSPAPEAGAARGLSPSPGAGPRFDDPDRLVRERSRICASAIDSQTADKNVFIRWASPWPYITHLESRYKNSFKPFCLKYWTHPLTDREVLFGCLARPRGITFHADGVHTRHFDTSGDVGIYFRPEKMMGGRAKCKGFAEGPAPNPRRVSAGTDVPPGPSNSFGLREQSPSQPHKNEATGNAGFSCPRPPP